MVNTIYFLNFSKELKYLFQMLDYEIYYIGMFLYIIN